MAYNIIGERKFRTLSELEREYSEAVARHDTLRYLQLCEELGKEPEFPHMIESGLAEVIMQERWLQELEEENDRRSTNIQSKVNISEIGNQQRYQKFYQEGSILNTRDYQKDSEQKKELLTKYFPKFRRNGKQPIGDMGATKVGYLFQKMLAQAEKKR
jgi:hypothetical protein